LSARFVRFCGRQTNCFVRLANTPGTRLLLSPRKVFTQLLGRSCLAFRFGPFGSIARAILPGGRGFIIRDKIVIIVHKRTISRNLAFSTAPAGFCTMECRSRRLLLALVMNLWQ
jgi:hypothetical protein